MRRTCTRIIAALSFATFVAACAAEGDEPLTDEELSQIDDEELSVDSDELAAAGPSLTLVGLPSCNGWVFHYEGQAITTAPVTVTFTISGGTHVIPSPGGHFSFNPGGSGVLKAKACKSGVCTTRSKTIQWQSCAGTNPHL
jgi:hypothetical protein